MNEPMLYRELRAQIEAQINLLPDKPEETIDSTLRALWYAAQGAPISATAAATLDVNQLSEQHEAALRALVEQRLRGVPLAHLTGRQRFMGMEMQAGPAALVPRKETELLSRASIDLASQLKNKTEGIIVVDVCTGSGNVALAIAHHVANAHVYGADLSEAAVELAQCNARHLNLSARAEFRAGDLLTPFDAPEFLGRVDLLTCNPPYINSAKVEHMPNEISGHEPTLAFDGGPFGVAILMRLIQEAPRFVRSGGWLAFEVGLGQGPALVKRMQKTPAFHEVRMVEDDAGAVRVVLARC